MPTVYGAEPEDGRHLRVQVGQRLTHEDNLYRLPAGIEPAELLGTAASRDDRIASTTAGITGRWHQGKQELALDVDAAANRFATNEDLDNTSGKAALNWNWQLGGRWSGQLGGRREQALASFANTSSLDKDVIDTRGENAAVRLDVGPRLRASASARRAATTHGNAARLRDDAEIESGAVGLEYHTPSENSLGVEYRESRATYSHVVAPGAEHSASDYEEHGASVKLRYSLTDKVLLTANAGYLEREYPLTGDAAFSGDVWSAALVWSPIVKAQLALQRWRELRAHFDAESDHFVSNGSGVQATWAPIDGLTFSLQLSREEQRYIGIDPLAAVDSARYDVPLVRAFAIGYAPRERVSFELSYRNETRDSNRWQYGYAAEAVTIGCEVNF